MTVNVREAEEKDIVEIVALWKDFMVMLPQINPHYWKTIDGADAFSIYLSNNLVSSDVLVTVAEKNEVGLVGFSLALVEILPEWFGSEQIGLIRYQSVSKKFRGKGVGHAMTNYIIEWFRSKSISRIEVYVLKGLPASEYWSQIGFKEFMDRRFLEI